MSFLFTDVTDGSTSISGVNATLTQGSTTVTTFSFGNSDKYVDTLSLTAGATYKLLLDPQGSNAGSITATVYSVPADATVAGTLGSTSAGRWARPARAPRSPSAAPPDICCRLVLERHHRKPAVQPDRRQADRRRPARSSSSFSLYGARHHDRADHAAGHRHLHARVRSQRQPTPAGSTSTCYDVPADATATATIGGGNVTATTTVPGQNGQISFTTTTATRSRSATTCPAPARPPSRC